MKLLLKSIDSANDNLMYLFGAYSPITGDHFELEFPQCNGDNFQIFLDEFSKENEQEFKIILLDNGACHKVQKLIPIIPRSFTARGRFV